MNAMSSVVQEFRFAVRNHPVRELVYIYAKGIHVEEARERARAEAVARWLAFGIPSAGATANLVDEMGRTRTIRGDE